jgi:hypothetical protein
LFCRIASLLITTGKYLSLLYRGFLHDTQTVEDFRDVEVSSKDKFLSRMIRCEAPTIFNEKLKDSFSVFLLKCLNITGYNLMYVPINDEKYGSIGCIIFANKNINKEKKSFEK